MTPTAPTPSVPMTWQNVFHDAEDGTRYARLGSVVETLRLEAALRDSRLSYATSIRKHRRGTRDYVVTVYPTRPTPLPAHAG